MRLKYNVVQCTYHVLRLSHIIIAFYFLFNLFFIIIMIICTRVCCSLTMHLISNNVDVDISIESSILLSPTCVGELL